MRDRLVFRHTTIVPCRTPDYNVKMVLILSLALFLTCCFPISRGRSPLYCLIRPDLPCRESEMELRAECRDVRDLLMQRGVGNDNGPPLQSRQELLLAEHTCREREF